MVITKVIFSHFWIIKLKNKNILNIFYLTLFFFLRKLYKKVSSKLNKICFNCLSREVDKTSFYTYPL